MLAPVVTKEMQLFKLGPTNKNNLRNVRARAQSLNEGLSAGSAAKQQLQSARSVSAGGHRPPKSSMSLGNLPSLSGSANSSGPSSTSSSPPKNFAVRKATLDPIVEGVELGSTSASTPAIVAKKRSGSTPNSEDSQKPTTSTLQKHATSDSLVEKEEKKKKEGGVLGWLSKTFSKKSKSDDEPGTSRETAASSSSSSVSGAGDDSPSKKPAAAPKKRV